MNAEIILSKLAGGRNIDRLDRFIWLGKNYSLADLKSDLMLIGKPRTVTLEELPTVDELWEKAYKDLSDSIDADVVKEVYIKVNPSLEFIQLDCVVTKEGAEFKEMNERVKKASKSANVNALSQMDGEKKC